MPKKQGKRHKRGNQGESGEETKNREEEFFTHTTSFLVFGGSVD